MSFNSKQAQKFIYLPVLISFLIFSAIPTYSLSVISKNANVLTLGDSITAGMDEKDKWVGNYYSELDRRISKLGYKWNYLGDKSRDNHIYYQADGGFCLAPKNVNCPTSPKSPNSITELYNQFKVNHKEKLDLVFIQGGVNDISAIRNGAKKMPFPIISLKALISQVQKDNPGVKIIVLDISRVQYTPLETQYNNQIYKLNKPDKGIYSIKTSNLRNNKYFIDGLHPNNLGYSALSELIYNQLRSYKLI